MRELVSVVILSEPLGNDLERIIRRIQIQTYSFIEMIICDNQESDRVRSIIDRLSEDDSRMTYLACKGKNASEIRKQGITKAKGSWIAFVEEKVLWNPTKLEIQLRDVHLLHSQICCTNAYTSDGKKLCGNVIYSNQKQKEIFYQQFLKEKNILWSSILFADKVAKELSVCNDWENISQGEMEKSEMMVKTALKYQIVMEDVALLQNIEKCDPHYTADEVKILREFYQIQMREHTLQKIRFLTAQKWHYFTEQNVLLNYCKRGCRKIGRLVKKKEEA